MAAEEDTSVQGSSLQENPVLAQIIEALQMLTEQQIAQQEATLTAAGGGSRVATSGSAVLTQVLSLVGNFVFDLAKEVTFER